MHKEHAMINIFWSRRHFLYCGLAIVVLSSLSCPAGQDPTQEELRQYLERLQEAHSLMAKDALSNAVEVLEQLDYEWPSDALVWRAFSELREREGNTVEAVKAARESFSFAKDNRVAGRLYLVRLLERLERFEEAQELVDEGLMELKTNKDSYSQCRLLHEAAHIQLQLGHWRESLSYVNRALELGPYAESFSESLQSIKQKATAALAREGATGRILGACRVSP